MLSPIPEGQWSQLSEFIAESMGLHFPRDRWDDLERGFAGATQEFGFENVEACVAWLLSAPPNKAQVQVLANHLTVGESYFYREPKTIEALAETILPELIRNRRGRDQRLCIWSAACCSGEEAYSLAILMHQLLPDLPDWHVTITATDINARFLQKAAAGTYGEWSFRNVPAWLKERYFKSTTDGRFAVVPEIRKLVTFAHLNLVEDLYPSLATNTNAMDLIFCRNVLMYFTPFQIRKVIRNLNHALVEGGWLAVSPSEASHTLFPQFITVNFPGAILYQKNAAKLLTGPTPMASGQVPEFVVPPFQESSPWRPSAPAAAASEPTPLKEAPVVAEASRGPQAPAESLYQEGQYAAAADTLLATFADRPPEPAAFSLLARALANQGRLADALAACDRWIAVEKSDPAGHFLRAVIMLERGASEQARSSLQRAIYLQPDFVLAHFALGNLARGRRKVEAAGRHFANALDLLRHHQANDVLPESDGLTAGRLTEIITSMTAMENAP